jgi:hypothetical protein
MVVTVTAEFSLQGLAVVIDDHDGMTVMTLSAGPV